jgi:pantoate--beta-alanine ligase
MASIVTAAPLGELDYVEVADPVTLRPVDRITSDVRLFGAVRFGRARLIDNEAARPGGLAGDPS